MVAIVLLAMTCIFSCVIRPAWEGAMITAPLLQGVTGEEVAVQVLVVVMEAVLGTSQLVF